jgi:hypothetical protein
MQDLTRDNAYRFFRNLPLGVPTYELLFYQGPTAASEFLTYSNKKLYFVYKAEFSYPSTPGTTVPLITFYDPSDVAFFYLRNCAIQWNTGSSANNFFANNTIIENIYFSRLVSAVYNMMMFNGVKLTWP